MLKGKLLGKCLLYLLPLALVLHQLCWTALPDHHPYARISDYSTVPSEKQETKKNWDRRPLKPEILPPFRPKQDHPTDRKHRFPNVQERVRLYMSMWYPPMCPQMPPPSYQIDRVKLVINDTTLSKPYLLGRIIQQDTSIALDYNSTVRCAQGKRDRMHLYCRDTLELFQRIGSHSSAPPILVRFGDSVFRDRRRGIFPFFGKIRMAASKSDSQAVTEQSCSSSWTNRTRLETIVPSDFNVPIVWNFNKRRHWGRLEQAQAEDIPWKEKKIGTLWRGALTGFWEPKDHEDVNCARNPRCNFVQSHANSTLVDAGLTITLGRLSPSLENLLQRNESSMREIQSYKVIVSIEGNDVASGLKWGLLSNSVILMPPPTKTSWAMEEILEPWIHYIPIYANGSNTEEMIEWVRDNDAHARQIAERGTLFIQDFLYHNDSAREEEQVKAEIVRRYKNLWASH